jgi:hypothetical protein
MIVITRENSRRQQWLSERVSILRLFILHVCAFYLIVFSTW